MKKPLLPIILAGLGTFLVWLPILAPIVFSVGLYIRTGIFHFDYLMPAEMVIFFLIGGILLMAGLRLAGLANKLIRIGFWIGAGAFLLQSALIIVVSLAGGAAAERFWMPAAIILIAVYTIAVIVTGIGGGMLMGELFRMKKVANS
jgi:hypothetical protein